MHAWMHAGVYYARDLVRAGYRTLRIDRLWDRPSLRQSGP